MFLFNLLQHCSSAKVSIEVRALYETPVVYEMEEGGDVSLGLKALLRG